MKYISNCPTKEPKPKQLRYKDLKPGSVFKFLKYPSLSEHPVCMLCSSQEFGNYKYMILEGYGSGDLYPLGTGAEPVKLLNGIELHGMENESEQ